MDSQQEAGMQLEDSSGWTVAAYEAVQDISSGLQAGRDDDVQPLDDAPNYQVLCGTARDACCHAEAGICSSMQQAAQLHPKELDCLCQLSTATLQLSSAVCCDPAVALPLISSGTHTPALDQLKSAVKSLTNLWASCMAFLQQQEAACQHHDSSSSQQAWKCLTPALATSIKHLLHMSVTSAEFVSSSGSSQQVPKEMCSMSALNLSWANLTRLLVAVPEGVRMQVLAVEDLLHGLRCALRQLHTAVMELPLQARERQEVLVRFWLQSVSRLTSAAWEDAARQALQPLMQVTLNVYAAVVQQREDFAAVQDILQQLLQPRLLACLSSLLSSSTDPAALQTKLDILLQRQPATAAHQDSTSHHQQQQLKAQVQLVLDVLQGALPNWPLELVAPGCKQLVCWALSTTGRDLLLSVLAASDPSAATACNLGPACDGKGLELLQGVLQGCLVGLMVCWGLLQDMQQQQMEMLAAVNSLALSAHPLVGFLACQLLANLVAASGSSELASQQLALMHKLMGACAAAAAVPRAGWEACAAAEAATDSLATVLQACDPALAAQWLKQHVMPSLSNGGSGSSSAWLDAGACAWLKQESVLLQRVASASPQLMPLGQAQLEEAWTQLWSTGQQVAELVEPQQLKQLHSHTAGSTSGGGSLTQQQAETVLVLHQLSWLLSAMQGILQLSSALDTAAANSLKQGAVDLCLDVLKAVGGVLPDGRHHSAGSQTRSAAAATMAARAQYACCAAALRLLAVPGQVVLSDGQAQGLLACLSALVEQQEGLHAVLAGVLGNLGVIAKAGSSAFEVLFQQLLSSPHWQVRHAAFDALLQILRHVPGLGTNMVNLLPAAMRISATEAVPEVINTVKAHLHKQPDSQAQAAFAQHYPQLAAQHMQHLSAHARSHSSAAGQGGRLTADSCSAGVQELQLVLAACAAATHDGAGNGGCTAEAPAHECEGGPPGVVAGGAQALLVQAAAATKSLQSAEQALSTAEADVRLLMSAATAAARGHALGAEGILLVSKQGSSLMGNVASMISRLRALQDGLSTLRPH